MPPPPRPEVRVQSNSFNPSYAVPPSTSQATSSRSRKTLHGSHVFAQPQAAPGAQSFSSSSNPNPQPLPVSSNSSRFMARASTSQSRAGSSRFVKYAIPPSSLCGMLIICTVGKSKIVEFPAELRGKYERNYFRFNLCLVFDRLADLSCYEPIVRKLSRVLISCEEESYFLSLPEMSPKIDAILEQLNEDLNSYSETSIPMVKYTDTERGWIRQQLDEQQSRLDDRLVEDRSRINRLLDMCQEAAKDNRTNEARLKSLRERVNEATELWGIVQAHILRVTNLQTTFKNHTNETSQRFAVLERHSPDEDRRNTMRVASLERAVRVLHRCVNDAQVRNEETVEGLTRRAGNLEKVELRRLRPVLYTAVFILSLVFHLLKVDVLSYVLSFFPTFNFLA
ncbi:NPR2-domain-containing protein [Artomyces pyxidatus]|uniref:NPR2-domain-containing protein n=1 Tax=Artomyces pyxidatus TaxID=48021 RepID=A0ACB8SLL3_9AGAM|nr:NPR2-domain-containing protein [Artomyces pyxidatus]